LEGVLKKDPAQDYNKKGAKYELDRENWTTYANFSDMYLHIYDEMENAKVATRYDEVNTKDKHFTVLRLTALNGDAIMCVVIFAGIRE